MNPSKRGRATRLALAALGAVGVLAIFVGAASALNGSVTLGTGPLSVTEPGDFTIASTPLTGAVMYLSSGPVTFDVTDATGSGSGWSVDVAADDFTCDCSGNNYTLGAFEASGSATHSDNTPPAVACHPDCSGTDTSSVSYPVTIASSGTTDVFDQGNTTPGSGMGALRVSQYYWWVTVPAAAHVGAYTSTVTFTIQSGPGN